MDKNNVQKKLGEKICLARIDKAYSQEELADKTGLHRTYIGSVERGERNISLKNLLKITSALQIRLSDLFKELGL